MAELLIGLALTLVIGFVVLSSWITLRAAGVETTDGLVTAAQARVAVARFERDCRLASAEGVVGAGGGPVLVATPDHLVLLSHGGGPDLEVIEWEIVEGKVMRRRGRFDGALPSAPLSASSFPHTRFFDHKTIVEGVSAETHFVFTFDSDSGRCVCAGIQGRLRVPGARSGSRLVLETLAAVGY